jgi:hypothetical protein
MRVGNPSSHPPIAEVSGWAWSRPIEQPEISV